jgi:hypothetical protein
VLPVAERLSLYAPATLACSKGSGCSLDIVACAPHDRATQRSNGIDRPMLRPRTRTRPRAWGISLAGKRRRLLGFVEAIDEEAAKAAVVDELRLSHKLRKRLVVQELPG